MSETRQKRKTGAAASDGSAHKKRKEGTGGRWKTPAQKAKHAEKIEMGTAQEVGDQGIWVTYARGMKGKAIREFKELCDEAQYGEKLYGIKPVVPDQDGEREEDEEQDIESAIQQELSDMKAPPKLKSRQVFSPVSVSIECVFFMKTMQPVDPVRLVREICQDARECPSPLQRKCRYINRLTPVVDTDKATENGIKKVAHRVLEPFFRLRAAEEEPAAATTTTATATATAAAANADATKGEATTQTDEGAPNVSYAIRHNVRNHTVFKSSEVINMVAAMIQPSHKVNLTNPDKVILIEIFQMYCGISVVDGGEWEDLKRYNMNALYGMTAEQKSGGGGGDSSSSSSKKIQAGDDAPRSES